MHTYFFLSCNKVDEVAYQQKHIASQRAFTKRAATAKPAEHVKRLVMHIVSLVDRSKYEYIPESWTGNVSTDGSVEDVRLVVDAVIDAADQKLLNRRERLTACAD